MIEVGHAGRANSPPACYSQRLWIESSEGERKQIRCASCGQVTPGYDIVNFGSIEKGYPQICSRRFNAEVTKSDGLDKFEHVRVDPVELTDCTGVAHLFHFRTRLFGPGIALEAFQLRDGNRAGYQFQVIGDPADDLLELLGRLIDKTRRALSKVHIGDGEFGLQISDHLEWKNPHIWVYLDVKDDHTNVQHWQCEDGAPKHLTRNGCSKDSLKPGDQIAIDGYLAKDGSKTCNARAVKLPNGRSLFAGCSAADAPYYK